MKRPKHIRFTSLQITVLALGVIFLSANILWASGHIDMEAARREGKVTLYSSQSLEDIRTLAKEFEKKYPWIKVEIYRAGKIRLAQRIVTEAGAGKHQFDVLLSGAFTSLEMKLQKLLGRYESPERAHFLPELKDPEGYWTAATITTMSVALNTKLVKRDEIPRQWGDLLIPKWRGKIAINANRPDWYIGLFQIMGEEDGRRYMKSLASSGTIPVESSGLAEELLAAGEYPLYANASPGTIEQLKKKGAPVDWARVNIVPAFPVLASVSSYAKFPHTARLLDDFLLSEEGQKTLRALQRIPARRGVEPNPPHLTQGMKIFHINYGAIMGRSDDLEGEFRKTFALR